MGKCQSEQVRDPMQIYLAVTVLTDGCAQILGSEIGAGPCSFRGVSDICLYGLLIKFLLTMTLTARSKTSFEQSTSQSDG